MAAGPPDKVAVYALTAAGAATARRLATALAGARLFLPQRLAQAGEQPFARLAEALGENFGLFAGHVVVAAAGIVVRAIAPLLAAKTSDPAVVVLDQGGRFAISLLAGHLGGANDLAQRVAAILGGQAVITTATDQEGLPALELEAKAVGLAWDDLAALPRLARALVEGETVAVHDPQGWLWPSLRERWPECFTPLAELPGDEDPARPLLLVTPRVIPPRPGWLVLRPPCLCLGLGCNRGTAAEEMAELVAAALAEHGLARTALACLASVEAKRDETGLIELAERLGLELVFFSTARLEGVAVPNPSGLVRRHMGTSSVCEAAAILAARGGPLVMGKRKSINATLAMALRGPGAASG
jgi:cobalt-precorrin 5A hydrolase